MSRSVTQSVAADLVAVLTNSSSAPVTGLVYTDVTVEYRKDGGSFIAKSLAPTAAEVASANAETYVLVDAQTITVAVDGGAGQVVTFNTADFSNISLATAAEVAAVITTDLVGATAADVGGLVVITSDSTGATSSIEVTGGAANTVLGFPTTQEDGSTFFTEVGSGVYTIEFTTNELDIIGNFIFKVTGATISQFVSVATVIAATEPSVSLSVSTCVVTGHIVDLSGAPMVGVTVSARMVGGPNFVGAAVLGNSLISARTDANGEFFLEVARLSTVDITIPTTGYRRQLLVPNSATVNLFTEAV